MIKNDKIVYNYFLLQRRNSVKNIFLKKLLCFILCVSTLIPCLPINIGAAVEIPTDKSLLERVEYYYAWAKRYNNNESFKNYCAHYVNLQLQLLGINKKYVGGNGNDEYDNYKNLQRSQGGRKIHNYPANNANFKDILYEISSLGPVVTDVLVGFQWTNTNAGKKYGHTFFIHGIIGEYVYFSDSFTFTFGGKTYKEGTPIKWTIDQVVAYYGRSSHYTVEGLIWFEDEALSQALGMETDGSSGGTAGGTSGGSQSTITTGAGVYEITYSSGMRLRSGPGTNYTSLEVIPNGASVYVTEVQGDWGYLYYNGKFGWTCLPSYTKRTGNLPKFLLDTYNGSTPVSRVGKSSLKEALSATSNTSKYNYTVIATANVKLAANTSINEGVTLSLGSFSFDKGKYTFTLNGGVVRSDKSIKALADDPMINENVSGGAYVYMGHIVEMSFTGLSLIINDNVSMRLSATVEGVDKLKNPEVVMITTDKSGFKTEYKPDSAKSGVYVFTTEGIPARKLGDAIKFAICVRSSTFGSSGSVTGAEISLSPRDYVGLSYGSGERLDNLLSSMLNYGTEAQIYFNYNTSSPANSILPADKRNPDDDGTSLVKANGAPIIEANSTVHIASAQLVLLDNVALRLLTDDGDSGSATLSLLVWTEEDYLELCEKAEAAGKNVSEYLVKGKETYTLKDVEGTFTLENIPAKKFADTYYFRLCQTDGKKVLYDKIFPYSVTSYCAKLLANGKNDEIDPLCMAIAQYSSAARDYFGYEING